MPNNTTIKTIQQNLQNFELTTLTNLKSKLIGTTINHNNFGSGTIKDINLINETYSTKSGHEAYLRTIIKFNNNQEKQIVLKNSLNNLITVNNPDFENILNSITKEYINYSNQLAEAQDELTARVKEEEQQEKEKISAENKKAKEKDKFNNHKMMPISKKINSDLYYAVGWMANHTTSITAKLPDFLEEDFSRTFDYNPEDITVINSNRRTSGGHAMQWSLSMSVRFKVKSNERVPELVAEHFKNNSNTINSVDFVWTLIDQYGFKFGKKQDIDTIREQVPSEYLSDFDAGLEH